MAQVVRSNAAGVLLRPHALVLAVGLAALGVAAWRAGTRPGAEALPVRDQEAASGAVRLYLTLTAHLRGAGDPRFAERLPADPAIVDEVVADVRAARAMGKREEPRLLRAEIRAVRPMGPELAEVLTKEFWVTRDLAAQTNAVHSDVTWARYTLRRDGAGWRVAAWDLDTAAMDGLARGGGGAR